MLNEGDWSPTYLATRLIGPDRTDDTIVTTIGRQGARVLADPPFPVGTHVELQISPRPGSDPVTAAGTVAETVTASTDAETSEGLDPELPAIDVRFEEPSDQLLALVERELRAEGRHRRVAVVDDDLTHLRLMQAILRKIGFDAICIHGSLGATNVIAESNPSLILLDIAMPELGGRMLCKMLRSDERFRDTPVIFLSALPLEKIRSTVNEAGADGFIEKGSDLNRILVELRKYLPD